MTKLHLPEVTLFMFESKDPSKGAKVFSHVANLIEFDDLIFASDQPCPRGLPRGHNFINEPFLPGLHGSARFVISYLADYLCTSHVLIIHIDGFPIHPEKWQPEFLDYDYIGAPWPDGVVGNGVGLRSMRLCRETSLLKYEPSQMPEDEFICRHHRKHFESTGIKFAPSELARQFSREQDVIGLPIVPYDDVFMFHGSPEKGGYPTQQFIERALK